MKPYTYLLITAILIGAVYLAGCTARVPSPSPIPTISETATPEPSLTLAPTLTPSVTRTAKPTATATREPLPTLPPTEALEKVQELLETNGGCAFPCWWGITPGETNWEEVVDTLQPIAWRISSFKNHPVYKDKVTREFYFAIDDQPTLMNSLMAVFVLEKATLRIEWITTGQNYNLISLLESLGPPEEVWMTATGIPITGPTAYEIYLFYPAKGIMASIGGDARVIHQKGDDFVLLCQSMFLEDAGGLRFWSPDKKIEFHQFFREFDRINGYLPIESVLGNSLQEFTDFILENDDANCLEIPMSKWEN